MKRKIIPNLPETQSGAQEDEALKALKGHNYMRALDLYEPLARNGSRRAMLVMGILQDSEQIHDLFDPKSSIKWYEKAFAHDSLEAARMLARIYYLGRGVPIDYGKAFKYYHWLSERSCPIALFRLALMYRDGQGVEKNINIAREYYKKSVICGHVFARKELGLMILKKGRFLSGLLFLVTAVLEGGYRAIFTPESEMLRWF